MKVPNAVSRLILLSLLTGLCLCEKSKDDEDDFSFEDDYDIGCNSNRPAMCPDGNCYEDYSFCQPLRGCTSQEAPILCPSGLCALDFAACGQPSQYACDLNNYRRCADGICRQDCAGVQTNGCPVEAPFYCPDGHCARNRLECASELTRFEVQP